MKLKHQFNNQQIEQLRTEQQYRIASIAGKPVIGTINPTNSDVVHQQEKKPKPIHNRYEEANQFEAIDAGFCEWFNSAKEKINRKEMTLEESLSRQTKLVEIMLNTRNRIISDETVLGIADTYRGELIRSLKRNA